MKTTKTYSDLDFNFRPHPITGDISAKIDDEAVKNSIRNLLTTMTGERPFNSGLGSALKRIMFEPITPVLVGVIQREVLNAVLSYEPRVSIEDIVVNYFADRNTIEIVVIFKINGSAKVSQTNIVLERTR